MTPEQQHSIILGTALRIESLTEQVANLAFATMGFADTLAGPHPQPVGKDANATRPSAHIPRLNEALGEHERALLHLQNQLTRLGEALTGGGSAQAYPMQPGTRIGA